MDRLDIGRSSDDLVAPRGAARSRAIQRDQDRIGSTNGTFLNERLARTRNGSARWRRAAFGGFTVTVSV